MLFRSPLTDAVTVTAEDSNIRVKGPNGELVVSVHPMITVRIETDPKQIVLEAVDGEDQDQRALWGLMRQLVSNAVLGVQTPYKKSLEFVGVGYKVAVAGNEVKMSVGYSHPVDFPLPEGLTATVEKSVLTITGIDKQLVGETAAQIRRIRPPEPYKGKGIKYIDEVIRRKAGKTAAKTA